jgi:UDP-N-acetylglucosamine 2-epimerase (non-hydrolysing)
MKTIIHVVGARPNFIKAAPLIDKLSKEPINNIIVHTGQHYDYNMSKTFFEELNIPEPNYHLGAGGGSHTTQTVNIMLGCERVFNELKPDAVIVYGDINSCMAAAIVASKMHLEGMDKISIIHVESGLRSGDKTMPEELNRIITDSLADILFVTSEDAIENILGKKLFFVGNTMIDSLVKMTPKIDQSNISSKLSLNEKYALITMHRPSNVDSKKTLEVLMDEIVKLSNHIQCIMPLHPRTRHRLSNFGIWKKYENQVNLKIIDPVGYLDFMNLQKNATVIITDSGGIQEESSYFNVPCLTVRNNTERPITITNGTNKLIGTSYTNIVDEYEKINILTTPPNIKYWDGKAASRIVNILKKEIKW